MLPPWNDTPTQIAYLPIGSVSSNTWSSKDENHSILGILVVGINTHHRIDDAYMTFLNLLSSQISSSLLTARSYDEEKKRLKVLAELDLAKTTFFNNISHEFRTPLTLMLGPLEELLNNEQKLSITQQKSISLVHRNGIRLLKLVNVLLDFSRIEAGRMTATYRPVNLPIFTAELASIFRSACEKAKINLLIECSQMLSENIYVDVDMWEKIVLNIISNAFKYTLKGEIKVSIEEDKKNEKAILIVKDTGCGIPEDEMPRLFERFHRIKSTHGRSHEGTGIGLALVYELVKLHDGKIKVESKENVGTVFSVEIPFGFKHLPPESILNNQNKLFSNSRVRNLDWWIDSSSNPGSPLSTNENRMMGDILLPNDMIVNDRAEKDTPQVLVVDDNIDMLGYVSKILSTVGFQIVQAKDGLEALKTLKEYSKKPDLILSDIMMPGMDGFGLLAEIRKTEELSDIPFIFLSARAGEEASSEGITAGADDYMCKPFSAKELVTRVNSRIELSRLRLLAAKREKELRKEAEQANNIKDKFLAVLSHELRTPLTPALLLAEQIQDDSSLPIYIKDDLSIIIRQIRLQVQLIDDLLDITKIRQGKLQLQMIYLDANRLLDQTFKLFSYNVNEKSLKFSLQLEAKKNIILGDSTRLQQIFWNLINNAIKFTPNEGCIIVKSWNEDNSLKICVQDDGIGIEPNILNRLFTAFEQGSSHITSTFGGLGLGLNISQTIATILGGSLVAYSEGKNKGAKFTLSLPLIMDPTIELDKKSIISLDDQLKTTCISTEMHSLNILLVEDNISTLMILKRIISKLGNHKIITASSVKEAKDKAQEHKQSIDLLVSDMGLPDGDGCELLLAIKPIQPNMKAIIITGFGSEADVKKSYDAGFLVHLTKPISKSNLENAIDTVCKK